MSQQSLQDMQQLQQGAAMQQQAARTAAATAGAIGCEYDCRAWRIRFNCSDSDINPALQEARTEAWLAWEAIGCNTTTAAACWRDHGCNRMIDTTTARHGCASTATAKQQQSNATGGTYGSMSGMGMNLGGNSAAPQQQK
jgi:hypothetical protein